MSLAPGLSRLPLGQMRLLMTSSMLTASRPAATQWRWYQVDLLFHVQ